MKTDPKFNPCEELCHLAEDCDHEGVKELIETYGVRGTEPPAGRTGEIFLYDIEQAMLKIPPRMYDNAIPLIQSLLYYKPSKGKITQALRGAVSKSQFRTVRLLLEHGADPNHLDEAAAVGDFDAIDTLIASGAEISLATRAVCLAAENGRTKTLQYLIDLGFPFKKELVADHAFLSNNPSTLEALRIVGVEYTAQDMDNEDLFDCPKSLEYLVNLGLPLSNLTEDFISGMVANRQIETLTFLRRAIDRGAALDPQTCLPPDALLIAFAEAGIVEEDLAYSDPRLVEADKKMEARPAEMRTGEVEDE